MTHRSAAQATFGWTADASTAPAEPRSAPERRAWRAARRVPQEPPAVAVPVACEPALPPDNELWDVRAAARFLKRSVSWVYHRAEDGTLPVKRLGGWGLRFVPGELRAWVDRGAPGRRG